MRAPLPLITLSLGLFLAGTTLAFAQEEDVNSGAAVMTASESCRAACDREFVLCGEEGEASDDTLHGRPSADFGKNYCNDRMKDCQQGCKGL